MRPPAGPPGGGTRRRRDGLAGEVLDPLPRRVRPAARRARTCESFDTVDAPARALARESITVTLDRALGEMEARIEAGGETLARVETALGSPARPMDAARLERKLHELAGRRLDGVLATWPSRSVVAAAGLT